LVTAASSVCDLPRSISSDTHTATAKSYFSSSVSLFFSSRQPAATQHARIAFRSFFALTNGEMTNETNQTANDARYNEQ
jgi:hypothetical protein